MIRHITMYRLFVLPALVLLVCASGSYAAFGEQGERDALCQMLFDQYILSDSARIPEKQIEAAQEILASRGRHEFWKLTFEELRKNNQWNEKRCIDLLGRIYEYDADARPYSKPGGTLANTMPSTPSVCIPENVAPELIIRARFAQQYLFDHYLVALVRAQDDRCKDLFAEVLKGKEWTKYSKSEEFHAAIGLANMGDTAGVEWLIEHCENSGESVYLAGPATGQGLGINCVGALRSLAKRSDLSKKADFEEWWKGVPRPFVPESKVWLRDW